MECRLCSLYAVWLHKKAIDSEREPQENDVFLSRNMGLVTRKVKI